MLQEYRKRRLTLPGETELLTTMLLDIVPPTKQNRLSTKAPKAI
jgi:hypothetical protein